MARPDPLRHALRYRAGHHFISSTDLSAQELPAAAPESVPSVFQKDATDIAVDKAIAYLVSKQRDDGAVLDKGIETTMTALSIMAMASVGISAR